MSLTLIGLDLSAVDTGRQSYLARVVSFRPRQSLCVCVDSTKSIGEAWNTCAEIWRRVLLLLHL
jgi:hypothetical protein